MTAASNLLFPHNDPKQELRIKRFLLASVAYLMNSGFVLLCWGFGYFDASIFTHYLLLVIATNAGIFMLLRSGLNLRFRDPSLTFIQMAIATVTALYLMYFSEVVRSTFLILGVAMCVFGMFRFQTRGFIQLSSFLLAGYGVLILLLLYFRPHEINLKVELLQWLALLVTLTQFTFLAGYIGNLRRKVRENNLALAERNSELETALQRISDMAVRDELTGVYNRRYLMERIAEESQRCLRNGSVFCICVLDIDFFKKINDTYGHLSGDSVLRGVAATAGGALRQTDFFGRFGGEEFLMVLTDTPVEGALVSAERIRKQIEQLEFPDIAPQLRVTVSIGIAEHQRRNDPTETFKEADSALYHAKEGGRNRCVAA